MCAPVSMYTSCAVMNSLTHAHTLSLCLSISLSLCLSVSLSLCLSVSPSHTHTHCLSVSLSVCLSVSPELEKQLRTERKQTSSLKNELKTASDCSNVAEESMSRTIDKQHTKVCVRVCACVCLLFMINHLQHTRVRYTHIKHVASAYNKRAHTHIHTNTHRISIYFTPWPRYRNTTRAAAQANQTQTTLFPSAVLQIRLIYVLHNRLQDLEFRM